nr:transcription factor IIIB 90 kDa subunit isoform X2 [Ipomoea batatas]
MAVTPNPCESTKPQVVERVEVHKNLTAKTPLQMRSDGVTKRKRIGGGSATEDQTESLSDIDDSEVAGYLNSKEERHYKKIIWEKINLQFAMAQAKRKKETDNKKDKSGKGTAKTTKIDENKIRSSKVNYEALKQLTDELNQDIGDAEIVEGGSRSLSCVNSGGSNAKEVKVYESNSDELEEEEENPCSEDDYALRDSNYELYDEHEYGCYDIDYGND